MKNCKIDSYSNNSELTYESERSDSGKLLLHAVKVGNETVARKFLSFGIPVNVQDQFGCEPIYYAAKHNHLNILKMLIKKGASINATTFTNRTPLQIAAYHGHVACVKYLIDMQANVNAVDDLGMSALHWAAENNHQSTVEFLLKSGADPTLLDKFGRSAQRLALLKGNINIYELLEDINISNSLQTNHVPDSLETGDQDVTTKTFSAFLTEPSIIDGSSILKNRLLESGLEKIATSDKNDTIKLFEQHGIKLLPVDESTLVGNALKRGQIAVLTEAGKLALKKTEPSFLHNLVEPNSSNPFVQMSSKIVEKERLRQLPQKSKNSDPETSASKPKIVKIDASQSLNLTAKEILHVNHASNMVNTDDMKTGKFWKKNTAMPQEHSTQCANVMKKYQELEKHLKFFEEQLVRKSQAMRSLRNQLEVSMKLIKNFKTKYEIKEREASLYKIQLQNLLKMLAKKKSS